MYVYIYITTTNTNNNDNDNNNDMNNDNNEHNSNIYIYIHIYKISYHRVPAEWKRGDKFKTQKQFIFWRACCLHQYRAVVLLISSVWPYRRRMV